MESGRRKLERLCVFFFFRFCSSLKFVLSLIFLLLVWVTVKRTSRLLLHGVSGLQAQSAHMPCQSFFRHVLRKYISTVQGTKYFADDDHT